MFNNAVIIMLVFQKPSRNHTKDTLLLNYSDLTGISVQYLNEWLRNRWYCTQSDLHARLLVKVWHASLSQLVVLPDQTISTKTFFTLPLRENDSNENFTFLKHVSIFKKKKKKKRILWRIIIYTIKDTSLWGNDN